MASLRQRSAPLRSTFILATTAILAFPIALVFILLPSIVAVAGLSLRADCWQRQVVVVALRGRCHRWAMHGAAHTPRQENATMRFWGAMCTGRCNTLTPGQNISQGNCASMLVCTRSRLLQRKTVSTVLGVHRRGLPSLSRLPHASRHACVQSKRLHGAAAERKFCCGHSKTARRAAAHERRGALARESGGIPA
jgi:hypothetical protein